MRNQAQKRTNHNYFLYYQNLVKISLYIFNKFTIILRLSFLWLSIFLDFFQKVTRLDRFLLKWSFLMGSQIALTIVFSQDFFYFLECCDLTLVSYD